MLNLIVDSSKKIGKAYVEKGRIFEYTEDDIIHQHKKCQTPDFDKIKKYPTIFMDEGKENNQIVNIGYISNIKSIICGKKSYEIEYNSIVTLTNEKIYNLRSKLCIEDFGFSRNHWAMKNIDLFEILYINKYKNKEDEINPKVFNLNNSNNKIENLISVMMPFKEGLNEVYDSIKGVAKELSIECQRADDINKSNPIVQSIVDLICKSTVIICDCTEKNANVFYEMGISHTIGKEVILIAQSENDIPFDLSHIRYFLYHNNNEGRGKLSEKLKTIINEMRFEE